MVLTDEHARALLTVLATLFGGAVGWWLLVPIALRSMVGSEQLPARSTRVPTGAAAPGEWRDAGGATVEPASVEWAGAASSLPETASAANRMAGLDAAPRGRRVLLRPVAATVAGGSWGLIVWRLGVEPALPAVMVFAAAATVLAIVDALEQRLPNRVVGTAAAVIAVLLVGASAVSGGWRALLGAGLGAVAMFAGYLVVALISPAAMGMGDVKLAGLIGLLLGWFGLDAWLVGLVAAFVLGGVAAFGALLLRRVSWRGSIPFGPSMLAGALLAVLVA